MANPTQRQFIHHCNFDGSRDSICLHCYLTVATGDSEAHLVKEEELHACLGSALSLGQVRDEGDRLQQLSRQLDESVSVQLP
jgi:hypothetical protein